MADESLALERASDSLFLARLGGVEVCRVKVAIGSGVWELYTTVTEPGYQGRGYAGRLVGFALDAAREAGVRVIPSCWYVDEFMNRTSPRYDDLRMGGFAPDPQTDDSCRIAPSVVR